MFMYIAGFHLRLYLRHLSVFFHMKIYIWIQIVTVYGVSAKYTTRYIALRIAVYSGIVFHGPAIIRLRDCVYLIAVYEVDGLLE